MKKNTSSKFFVSRQHYWGIDEDSSYVVEVAVGGRDMAGADMLCARWSHAGEQEEFSNPLEAAQAAIDICECWRSSGQDNANVAYGFTGGYTMPFSPCTDDELMAWAQERFDKLPKCAWCDELLGKETFTHDLAFGEEWFCREHCADMDYEHQIKQDDAQDGN